MTLKAIRWLQGFLNAIPRPILCSIFQDFKWHSELRGSLVIAGHIVLTLGVEEGGDEKLEAAADEEAGTFTIWTSSTRLYRAAHFSRSIDLHYTHARIPAFIPGTLRDRRTLHHETKRTNFVTWAL